MNQKNYGTQEYRQQDVMSASPTHLVVMAYDLAITSCEKQDFDRATKSISVLRDALNFDYADAAMGLFRLYQWCLDNIRQGEYTPALKTLRELRHAWAEVEKRYLPVYPQAADGSATSTAGPAAAGHAA